MPGTLEQLAHPDAGAAVTPNDSTDLAKGGILYIGTGGDVRVDTAAGDTLTFSSVPDGAFLPVVVSRVYATSTTASNILALYSDYQ